MDLEGRAQGEEDEDGAEERLRFSIKANEEWAGGDVADAVLISHTNFLRSVRPASGILWSNLPCALTFLSASPRCHLSLFPHTKGSACIQMADRIRATPQGDAEQFWGKRELAQTLTSE